jgi:hypothetical protein
MNEPRPAAALSWSLAIAMVVVSGAATAQEPAPAAPSTTSSAPAAAPQPVSQGRGLAVLALAGATDAAWPLARAVYASPSLRPPIDEAHARVLAGEAPPEGSAQELKDLADTRAAVHGDDAPSRQLLASLGRSLKTRGILVVEVGAERPEARVFLVDASTFDAARYAPDATPAASVAPSPVAWTGAVQSLERVYGAAPAESASAAPMPTAVPGPSGALREGPSVEPPPKTGPRKFYESPWFWGAIGAAAFAAGAVYFATRDNSPGMIHLQMQVPKQ